MNADDWAKLGILGNEIGMQWYVVTHPGTSIPNPAIAQVQVPGVGQATFNTNLLILGAVAVALIVLWK